MSYDKHEIPSEASDSPYFDIKLLEDIRIDATADIASNPLKWALADAMQQDIDGLNLIIQNYNASDLQMKPLWLAQLSQSVEDLQAKYPGDVMTGLPTYQKEIHQTLFNEIKTLSGYSTPSFSSAEELLTYMPPEKASGMLEILSAGNERLHELQTLYAPHEEGYKAFIDLIGQYTLSFLSSGNATNFKMVRTIDNAVSVLKVENRCNVPKSLERELRRILPDTITPVYAERQATFNHHKVAPDKTIKPVKTTCSLLITSYCPGQDLEKHAQQLPDPKVRLDSAMNLYGQMGRILTKMQAAGYAFPDAKNSNWLIDNDTLKLADTKSFLRMEADGTLNEENCRKAGYGLLRSMHMLPPEMVGSNAYSADKMHAYMLGKNLYQYLIGGELDVFYTWNRNKWDSRRNKWGVWDIKNSADLDFSNPIFSSVEGQLLKQLIQDSLVDDPAKRKTLKITCARLNRIQHLDQVNTLKEHGIVLSGLAEPYRTTYYESVKEKLFLLVNDIHDVPNLLALLNPEQCIETCKMINLAGMVNDTSTFAKLLRVVPENIASICTVLEPELPRLIKSAQDFCDVVQNLKDEGRAEVCQLVKFSSIIHDGQEFDLVKNMLGDYSGLIKDEADFIQVCNILSEEEREDLCAFLGDDLVEILPSKSSFERAKAFIPPLYYEARIGFVKDDTSEITRNFKASMSELKASQLAKEVMTPEKSEDEKRPPSSLRTQ